jgi:hypothetical protein
MRMTYQQKADYKLYRSECKLSGVEPVRKDFLAGDIPSCVRYQLQSGVWSRDIEATRFERALRSASDDELNSLLVVSHQAVMSATA